MPGTARPSAASWSRPSHIYPGPVGVDIKCSMSLLQLRYARARGPTRTRRALINAITERTPTGRAATAWRPRGVASAPSLGERLVTEGRRRRCAPNSAFPTEWAHRCEDAFHTGHDGSADALRARLDLQASTRRFTERALPNKARISSVPTAVATTSVNVRSSACAGRRARPLGTRRLIRPARRWFAFLSHCGSRGWGALPRRSPVQVDAAHFSDWGIPLPGERSPHGARAARSPGGGRLSRRHGAGARTSRR
jgi:tRNA-splicing ligase RtcB